MSLLKFINTTVASPEYSKMAETLEGKKDHNIAYINMLILKKQNKTKQKNAWPKPSRKSDTL